MSETAQKPEALPHSISIVVDGEPFEVFMSFAMLNRICYLMGDSAQIPLLLQDPELREVVLVECLALRDPKGKKLVGKERGIDDVVVSFEDIQNVLEFVSEHVADFTVAAVEKAQKIMMRNQSRINALNAPSSSTPTPTGQEGSA